LGRKDVRVSISQAPPRETILVVDDELEVLALVADILQGEGYLVLRASDPREALRLSNIQSDPIHLLVTDVAMPFMTGRDLAEKLRTMRPSIQVLFMSGFTLEVIEDHGINIAPGDPFFVKPFTRLELSSAVRTLLDHDSSFSRLDLR
jgi:two-component system, cell cycle sensor histidine kinase and response regulator CckA